MELRKYTNCAYAEEVVSLEMVTIWKL